MKKLILIIVLIGMSQAYVQVSGYFKSNGTYVAPHYRSEPDGVKWNNLKKPPNRF